MKKPQSGALSYALRLIAAVGLLFVLALLASSPAGSSAAAPIHPHAPTIPGVRILSMSGRSYSSIAAMFKCVGVSVTETDWRKLESPGNASAFLIVPREEALLLSEEQSDALVVRIGRDGCNVITDGKSTLSKSLGIQFSDNPVSVGQYIWKNHPEAPVSFQKDIDTTSFRPDINMKILGIDTTGDNAIAVSGRLGKGRFIYSAIPLAPEDKSGYEHYPFILEALQTEFNLRPVLAKRDLALYLDLGLHHGERPRKLAGKIKTWGVNQVHLSAWYPEANGQRFTKAFIAAAHALGISVHAWLEYPMVSKSFWDEHPECREKTATDLDAKIDWRYLIALEDPECFNLVKHTLKQTMMDHDWDGLDLAELYFESPLGFDSPQTFTPMHRSFRNDFQKRWKVDPLDIFRPGSPSFWQVNAEISKSLLDYRIDLIAQLNESLLKLCRELKKKKPHLETVVTVIDTIFDAPMKERIGVDTDRFIQLQQKYPFILEIEDPYTLWSLGPGRYKLIGERYRSLASRKQPLYIDINIVDRQGKVYPTTKQRGLELYQLLDSAGLYTDKVILYGSTTLEPSDMAFAPYAQTQDISVEETANGHITFNSAKQFLWETWTGDKRYYLDGKEWPCFSAGSVIIPAGRHTIRSLRRLKKYGKSSLRLEDINGKIMNATVHGKGFALEYESRERCFVTLNRSFRSLKVDGSAFKARRMKNGSKTVLILPEGRHTIRLE